MEPNIILHIQIVNSKPHPNDKHHTCTYDWIYGWTYQVDNWLGLWLNIVYGTFGWTYIFLGLWLDIWTIGDKMCHCIACHDVTQVLVGMMSPRCLWVTFWSTPVWVEDFVILQK